MSQPSGDPGAPQPNNTLGLLSLILGIASLPMLFCFGLGLPAGVAAVVLGVLGKRRADDGEATNRGQAIAGMICGAVGATLTLLAILLPSAGEIAG
jgi:hypothetical protein